MGTPEESRSVVQHVTAVGGVAYGVIGADLHVFGDGRPIYQLIEHGLEPLPEEDGKLPAQPSLLLNARSRIVTFTGRDQDLDSLEQWRDDAGRRRSARWLHAPGGAGKSRLAAEFGLRSHEAGWKVVTVIHGRSTILPPAGSVDLRLGAAVGLLVIIDYADRWPLSHLSWLFSNALLHHDIPTRLLLVARSVQSWIPVRAELEALHVVCDQEALPAIPGELETGQRERMFTVARDCFVARYGVSDSSDIPWPGNFEEPEFGLVLALHMAALVAVDAHVNKAHTPTDMAGLSAYLLDRERGGWTKLYENRLEGLPFQTPPEVMARAVFVATLVGSMNRSNAKAILHRIDLEIHPDRLLDDHARCYPASLADKVLEPLYPDRLAEDFVALSLPEHGVANFAADTAANEIVKALLSSEASEEPHSHLARLLTVLASAAAPGRWMHVGSYLNTALANDPELALRGDSAALAAIAQVPFVEMETFEAIEALFPDHPVADLDLGIAALARRIAAHRLERVTSAVQHGWIFDKLAVRLRNAGFRVEALAARQSSTAAWRHLARVDPDRYEERLARALDDLGAELSIVGKKTEALQALEEALVLFRRLVVANPESYEFELALVLGNLAPLKAWRGMVHKPLHRRRNRSRSCENHWLAECSKRNITWRFRSVIKVTALLIWDGRAKR